MSRLYLIDDHLVVREGLRAMLEASRHTVVGESSEPTHALAELQRLEPDVVLLDLVLGARSGLEVLAEAQRRELHLRCIVLTMLAQPRQVSQAMRLGAYGFVLKTAPVVELKAGIEAVAQGRRYLGSAVSELAMQALAAQPGEGDPFESLSPRERQIVRMVVNSRSSSAIGAELHLSAKTVDTYRSRLMAKLGVGDLASLVRLAIRNGLVDND